MMNQDKLHDGSLFLPSDASLLKKQIECQDLMFEYNNTRPSQTDKRRQLLKKMLAGIGENCTLEPLFHANWGGHFLHLGSNIFINFNLTIVDDTHIYIGDNTMLGPNITISTAGHPVMPQLRGSDPYQFNQAVTIGKNCWIGAGVVVLPGVTIGDNSVIGAGSLVTSSIPADCVAYGSPCKVIRYINEHDRTYYFKDRKIDWEVIKK